MENYIQEIMENRTEILEDLYDNVKEDLYDYVINVLEEYVDPSEEGMEFIHDFANEFTKTLNRNLITILKQTVERL